MKLKIGLTLCVLLFTVSGALSAQESEGGKETNALNLTVDVGVLTMHSTSTLDTNSEEKIKDNTQEGEAPNAVWAFPLFDLRYGLTETHTQFFLGTPIEGSNIALSLGVIQPIMNVGIITASVAPSVGITVWENPYEENVQRRKTAVSKMTTNLRVDKVAFTPLNIAYAHRKVDVDEDEIGRLYKDLRRDGVIDSLTVTYDVGLTESSLVSPGLVFVKGDFAGKSNSFQQTELLVTYKKLSKAFMFMFEGRVEQSSFAKEHPLYEKTRRDSGVRCFALLRVLNLFAVESLHSNIVFGTGRNESNIDFFDNTTTYTALSVGYSF